MYLTIRCVETLRMKGVRISQEEEDGVVAAILLHDIGHGPFSHALEHTLVKEVSHEKMSLMMMNEINREMKGALSTAISIFDAGYPRRFLNELISGQLDMDRMDYLRRDSFFTGVVEGEVGFDRIIHMLNVSDDMLAIDEKGIYSVEKFLIARRLMYWQVYNHRTVLSAEKLLQNLIIRAKELSAGGIELFSSPALSYFLKPYVFSDDSSSVQELLSNFTMVDESDIFSATKVWMSHPDKILSDLSRRFVNRDLLAIELQNEPFPAGRIENLKTMAGDLLGISPEDVKYYVYTGEVYNQTYAPGKVEVRILLKNGDIRDITTVSDILDHKALSEKVTKFFLCYPKECRIN
jgi:uncharacterized protein